VATVARRLATLANDLGRIVEIDAFPVADIEDAAARVRSLIERIVVAGPGDEDQR
jgi:hypothetical protein